MIESLRPRCSVVIPVFNRSDLLCRVLEGLVNQSLPREAFEVLVCDDGSTESISSVVASVATVLPSIRYLRQPNQGPAAARNLGIAHASSDIVVFLDSDVIPGDTLLAGLSSALDEHPDWQGAEAKLEPIGGEESGFWDAPQSQTGGHYHTAGIAYRKSALELVGGLDESFSRAACEDVDLAVRVLPHGLIGFVPGAVVYHPRRQRTLASCWKARHNWRFVQMLALRHGFMAWPGNKTAVPRLRTAFCAIVSLPVGKGFEALKRLPTRPADAICGLGLAFVDWLGGVAMLPVILLAPLPEPRSQLRKAQVPREAPGL